LPFTVIAAVVAVDDASAVVDAIAFIAVVCGAAMH
jgi:hypothetical protein